MIEKDFRYFLMNIFINKYTGCKKEIPDKFDMWLSDLDIDTIIEYGDLYAEELKNKSRNILNSNIESDGESSIYRE